MMYSVLNDGFVYMKFNNGMVIVCWNKGYKEWYISESIYFDDDYDNFWFYITLVLCGKINKELFNG